MVGRSGKGNKKLAYVGDTINLVVKKADPYSPVKKGEKFQAVVVRCRKERLRKDGSHIRFDDNACVLLASKEVKDPKGSRVFGPIAREVKDSGFNKIASLATEIY
jgi:large subunit ribosomal protein L14